LLRKVMSHVQANQCAEAVNLLESRISGCHPILKIAEDKNMKEKVVSLHPQSSPDVPILDPDLVEQAKRIAEMTVNKSNDIP
jgi:hypothetical protein